MKISVITVCLNAGNTIEDTLLSVFKQTCKNFELIVIDGASKDTTLEIIKKYWDQISYFVSEPDSGVYDAMNKGIKAASGDFLIFLNADDVFCDENVLEEVSKALEKNPDVKFLFGDCQYLSEGKKIDSIQRFNKFKDDFSIILNNICHQSIFYHKSLFEKFGGYSMDYKIYADWDFNIKCLAQNKIRAMHLPVIVSKFQLGGICSSQKYKKICQKEKNKLIEKYFSKHSFLIRLHNFLRKNIKRPYIFLMKILLIEKIVKSFISRDEYKLNLVPPSRGRI